MEQLILRYIIPITWILSSIVAIWSSLPVITRFRTSVKSTETFDPTSRLTKEEQAFQHKISKTDLKIRMLIAVIPTFYIILGMIVLAGIPMPLSRILTTILLYLSNWVISLRFYIENKEYVNQERTYIVSTKHNP